jgi:hypothetical protein
MRTGNLLTLVKLGIVALGLSLASVCAETPSKMTHAVVQMSGTGISADSFAAKPKTFWRATNQYCRVDEQPDPKKGIDGRLVINEPDAWLINLANNTAKHLLDPGPTFNCKLPIFAMNPEMAKSTVGELEVGRELDFFLAKGAKLVEGPKLSFETKCYELEIGDWTLHLVERVDIKAPILIALSRSDKSYQARYLLWEEAPFKADLFSKPSGVKIEDVK